MSVVEGSRGNSSLMALMAHQNQLMLLFLLPQTLEMVDLSDLLDKYSVSVEVDKQESIDFLNRQFQTRKPVKSNKIAKTSEKNILKNITKTETKSKQIRVL